MQKTLQVVQSGNLYIDKRNGLEVEPSLCVISQRDGGKFRNNCVVQTTTPKGKSGPSMMSMSLIGKMEDKVIEFFASSSSMRSFMNCRDVSLANADDFLPRSGRHFSMAHSCSSSLRQGSSLLSAAISSSIPGSNLCHLYIVSLPSSSPRIS